VGERPSEQKPPSLAKASGSMAIGTLASRVTGFVWKVQLAWVAGLGVINDSFTVANTLPNIVYELLMGGVFAALVVPLLVRAQDDPDGGREYTNRLLTVGMTMLLAGTVVAVAMAPLFTRLYMDGSTGTANTELTTAFAYLLLPEIVFYGLFALLSAILQAKHVFGPTGWAPVFNNVVIMLTIGIYAIVPGEISLNPVRMGDAKILVLGIGVTLGIAAQALVLLPALRRLGFRFRWTWGLDSRLKESGRLALWLLCYTLVTQTGMVITTRVLTAGAQGGAAIYSNAWLLFQLPYGVIGVSLLTAITPRMSRAAADGDTEKLIEHMSLGSRLCTVMLVPISAMLTVAGSAIGIALFGNGNANIADAERLGAALAFSAFGILPFALTMLQMRVFYAMKDSRTPTVIVIVMTAVKIPMLYLVADRLRPEDVVIGVLLVVALTYVVGAVLGQMWLWVRLGRLQSMRVVRTIVQTIAAGAIGALVAYGATLLLNMVLPDGTGPRLVAWLDVVVLGIVTITVAFGLLAVFRVPELQPAVSRITRLVRRR
jgi:putative peptidoglycan lipid II flippase